MSVKSALRSMPLLRALISSADTSRARDPKTKSNRNPEILQGAQQIIQHPHLTKYILLRGCPATETSQQGNSRLKQQATWYPTNKVGPATSGIAVGLLFMYVVVVSAVAQRVLAFRRQPGNQFLSNKLSCGNVHDTRRAAAHTSVPRVSFTPPHQHHDPPTDPR